MKMENMKLNTLAGGAVQEHFEKELADDRILIIG